MRNIRVYSGLGRTVETGLTRLAPGVNNTQEDNLTVHFMRQHADDIAIINLDGVIEMCGARVNSEYLVRTFGWSCPVGSVEVPKPPVEKTPEPELVVISEDVPALDEDTQEESTVDEAGTDDLFGLSDDSLPRKKKKGKR